MKKILASLFLLISVSVYAQRVELPDDLFITLPEGYEQVSNENYVLVATKGNDVIMIKMVDDKEFDRGKFMNRADRIYFNLDNYSLVYSCHEKFRKIKEDYKRKYYKASNGARVVTHTSHTIDNSYIVLATYATDEQLEAIEEMFDGIEVVPQKWTQRIGILFNTGIGFISCCFLLLMLIGSIVGQRSTGLGFLVGLIGYCLLYSCCWGDWPVYLALVGSGALFSIMAASVEPSVILQKMADGI